MPPREGPIMGDTGTGRIFGRGFYPARFSGTVSYVFLLDVEAPHVFSDGSIGSSGGVIIIIMITIY